MTVVEKAYAKINLFLDVTGRRDDGYHTVDTLMCSVSLHDTIRLNAAIADKTEVCIFCDNDGLDVGEDNLIFKATVKYLAFFDINANVRVELAKRIPIGAGLGGGSADAAATLRALNRIFGLASKEQLYRIASELGSDVPFCVDGGSAICCGRGEVVYPHSIRKRRNLVVAIGSSRVSTPKAYVMLDEKFGDFSMYNQTKGFSDMRHIPRYNIFEQVVSSEEIDKIKDIMHTNGAKETLMSGSGPAVFGEFLNPITAFLAKNALVKQGFYAVKCRMI